MTALEVLENNDYQFPVATNLDYYGPESSESDVADYEEFAAEYLSNLTGEEISTYTVDNYSRFEPDGMRYLRQEVWEEFCRSTH